jgi:mRNA interferase MazF
MANPGDVVIADFPGATATKRRPMVVISSAAYHRQRPDLILGVLTTNLGAAVATSDYVLLDWATAGLNAPTAFRCYLGMARPNDVKLLGHLTDRDWQGVQTAIRAALG